MNYTDTAQNTWLQYANQIKQMNKAQTQYRDESHKVIYVRITIENTHISDQYEFLILKMQRPFCPEINWTK